MELIRNGNSKKTFSNRNRFHFLLFLLRLSSSIVSAMNYSFRRTWTCKRTKLVFNIQFRCDSISNSQNFNNNIANSLEKKNREQKETGIDMTCHQPEYDERICIDRVQRTVFSVAVLAREKKIVASAATHTHTHTMRNRFRSSVLPVCMCQRPKTFAFTLTLFTQDFHLTANSYITRTYSWIEPCHSITNCGCQIDYVNEPQWISLLFKLKQVDLWVCLSVSGYTCVCVDAWCVHLKRQLYDMDCQHLNSITFSIVWQ